MKNKILKFVAVLCVALTMFTVSPVISASVGTAPIVAQAATVKLSASNLVIVEGQTKQLTVKGTSKKAKWSTNKKSVATVSSKGVVTAKGKGKAVITAKINKKTYTCKVTVEKPSISKTSASVKIGKTISLKIKGTSQSVKWTSSDTNIATVKNGVVTGVNIGSVTIKAKLKSGKVYKCSVNVKDISNVERLNDNFYTKLKISRNGTNNSYCQIVYENCTDKDIKLHSLVYANGFACYNSDAKDFILESGTAISVTYYRDLTVGKRYNTNDMYLDQYSTVWGTVWIDDEQMYFLTDSAGNAQYAKTRQELGIY